MKRVIATTVTAFLLLIPAVHAENISESLTTRSGFELGAQISSYRYEEPDVNVALWGPKYAIVAAYTYAEPGKDVFIRFDVRHADGKLKYEGSGTKNNVPDTIDEFRLVFGGDAYISHRVSVTPYFGFGYRHLANDLRGTTSTGAIGYRRDSYYRYIPVGATFHIEIGNGWVIAPTAEYDHFLGGKQISRLSDTGLGFSDASNTQNDGFGYRLSVLLERGPFAFGPWMHYWKIKDSDIVPIGMGFGGQEPANWTREFGVEFKYRF